MVSTSPTGRNPTAPEQQPRRRAVLGSGAAAALAAMDFSELELRAAAHYATEIETMENGIPNHVSVNEWDTAFWPHFRLLGVKINGEERKGDVHEFNVAEGWAMVRVKNNIGQFLLDPENSRRFKVERIQGKIEPYLKRPLPVERGPDEGDQARLAAAADKRARKAAKLAGRANG